MSDNPKRGYEPPMARALDGLSVRGQEGICQIGNIPIVFECATGLDPQQDPAACQPTGLLPERGRCTTGGNAVEGCVSGSALQ